MTLNNLKTRIKTDREKCHYSLKYYLISTLFQNRATFDGSDARHVSHKCRHKKTLYKLVPQDGEICHTLSTQISLYTISVH